MNSTELASGVPQVSTLIETVTEGHHASRNLIVHDPRYPGQTGVFVAWDSWTRDDDEFATYLMLCDDRFVMHRIDPYVPDGNVVTVLDGAEARRIYDRCPVKFVSLGDAFSLPKRTNRPKLGAVVHSPLGADGHSGTATVSHSPDGVGRPDNTVRGTDERSALLPAAHERAMSATIALGRMLAYDTVDSGDYVHASILVATETGLFVLHDIVTSSSDHLVLLDEVTTISANYARSVYAGMGVKTADWFDLVTPLLS